MFWKIIELLTRIVYARRIRHINRVGEAAKLAGQGDFQGAIERLDKMERKLHSEVKSFHALTRGRILDQLGRTEEAELEIIRAAKLDPSNMRAHLDLALMSARRRHFKNARARLKKLMEMAEPEIRAEAEAALKEVDRMSSGKHAKELV